MSQSVTLKDVANHAGVSYQTVSKVIHQNIQVREETARRVWFAIRELGYVPNEAARNLRLTQVSAIGYSWQQQGEQTVNPILEGFLQGMMSQATDAGYQISCFPTTGQYAADMALYDNLYQSKVVGGFILSNIEAEDARISYLDEHGIPFVCFGNPQREGFDYVEVDGVDGMYSVVNHLIERGHRRIALLGWEGNSRVGEERYCGYLSGLETAKIEFDSDLVCYGQGTVDFGYALVSELIKKAQFTAIAAMNDLMAIGAMRALYEAGLTPGSDVAVCGFDDFPLTQYLQPSLTTVHQPAFRVGKTAVKMLIHRLQDRSISQQQEILKPHLVIRDSSFYST